MNSSGDSAERSLLADHKLQVEEIRQRIQELQKNTPIEQAVKKKAELLDAIDEFDKLSMTLDSVEKDYEKKRREKQLEHHLSQFSIRAANIPKLPSSAKAALVSFGFATALDVKRGDVLSVHGIGPKRKSSIDVWVQSVKARFQFQSVYTHEDSRNITQAKKEIISEQQKLNDHVQCIYNELRAMPKKIRMWGGTSDAKLYSMYQKLIQIEVDLRHIDLAIPAYDFTHCVSTPAVSIFRKKKRDERVTSHTGKASLPACPKCNRKMIRRKAMQGMWRGSYFWGCSNYPRCKGIRSI